MNREFIPYELALELKQLRFDEPCLAFYQVEYHENSPIMADDDDEYLSTSFRTCKNSEIASHYTSCPTYSQAFRWFRDKYDLYCYVEPYKDNQFDYVVVSDLFGQEDCDGELLNTYEEAELACLRHLIKLVKENQK
jgi:hypothetical protein